MRWLRPWRWSIWKTPSLVVTADHSHTLTISGYPKRGNPILGKVEQVGSLPVLGEEPLAYTTLGYANGPGYKEEMPNLATVDTTHPNYQQLATVPLPVETHAGEDVAAFATGKNADGVRGVMEQNKLFDVMLGALFDNDGAQELGAAVPRLGRSRPHLQ